jgi:4-hydroxy-tetrahydrodipicolinate reductase
MAIDFSAPAAAAANVESYAAFGISAVVGTTGWYDRLEDAKARVEESGIGLLYGANFSVGAHLFFSIVAAATRRANAVEDYDTRVYEMHHRRKKDSPSGTALSLGKLILQNSATKKRIATERLDRPIEGDELHVASVRGGEIPGRHTVLFDSVADTIEVSHTARSRGGFALGAVLGAEWLEERSGFFEVEAFMSALFEESEA